MKFIVELRFGKKKERQREKRGKTNSKNVEFIKIGSFSRLDVCRCIDKLFWLIFDPLVFCLLDLFEVAISFRTTHTTHDDTLDVICRSIWQTRLVYLTDHIFSLHTYQYETDVSQHQTENRLDSIRYYSRLTNTNNFFLFFSNHRKKNGLDKRKWQNECMHRHI